MATHRPHRWSKRLGAFWDQLRTRVGLKRRYPVTVQAYRGFGSQQYLFMSGRVLLDKSILKHELDGIWRNLNNTIKRFNSREIDGAEIDIHFGGETFSVVTDKEGYYTLDTYLAQPLPPPPQEPPFWQQAAVELHRIPGLDIGQQYNCEVLIPGERASFGIISDIDDTILKSYVTSRMKWRMLYLTLLKNAFSRQAFSNVAPFFQSLRRGGAAQDYNPFFYVSNSPWNLYDLLEDFLDLNKLPRGPILLRDFGLPYEGKTTSYHGHKHEQIIRILQLYPEMPFVLIGDSGEKDVDIYATIVRDYPNRIKAIYIRDVRSNERAKRVQAVLDTITEVPTLLVQSYAQAAEHAAAHSLLSTQLYTELLQH